MSNYTAADLISFEEEIADLFNHGKIKAPIHLYSGNEDKMIEIFKEIKSSDWVLCSWRSHFQCLLKGVPKERLIDDIIKGRSISLCYKEYKIFSSAIVTGILPIAVGIAMDLKAKKSADKVYCFLGDMTSESGMAYECYKYSKNFDLPIRFIVEDNEKSVCSDTRKTWGCSELFFEKIKDDRVIYYKYSLSKYPHAGSGKRIQF